MKKTLLLSLFACGTLSLQAQITESATDAVKNMGLGWNLGNTLDANNGSGKDITAASYWGQQGLESETCWGQPYTKPELFKMMKEAGFGAIRVPITWYNHMDKDGNVDKAWMKRVHEVVDYVIDNGLYCIINVHHDTGADSDGFVHWIHADETIYNSTKEKYEFLWKQIAEEFKDYGNKLLFESYNEMLDAKSTWNAPGNTASYNAINSYAQSFVDIVRATGGNNETRNLIVNTYAAANSEAPVKNLTLPKDPTKDRTIVEVHAYPNFFTWSSPAKLRTIKEVKNDVDYIYNTLKNNVISKGVPAIIGEWGSFGVDNGPGKTDYDLRKDMFFEFCDYFVKKGKENNVATFYWMGLSDGQSRDMPGINKPVFNQADLAELIAKAYHGSSFNGIYPEVGGGDPILLFEGEHTLEWGATLPRIEASIFKSFGPDVQLSISYKLDFDKFEKKDDRYDDFQFLFCDDWGKTNHVLVTVDDKQYDIDFSASNHYNISSGTEKTTVFKFDKKTYDLLASKGLMIQGHGLLVTKMEVFDPNSSSIETIEDTEASSDLLYDLSGHRVNRVTRGIYIQGGKKIFVK